MAQNFYFEMHIFFLMYLGKTFLSNIQIAMAYLIFWEIFWLFDEHENNLVPREYITCIRGHTVGIDLFTRSFLHTWASHVARVLRERTNPWSVAVTVPSCVVSCSLFSAQSWQDLQAFGTWTYGWHARTEISLLSLPLHSASSLALSKAKLLVCVCSNIYNVCTHRLVR